MSRQQRPLRELPKTAFISLQGLCIRISARIFKRQNKSRTVRLIRQTVLAFCYHINQASDGSGSGSETSGISSLLTTVRISSSLAQSSAGKRWRIRSMTSSI